MYVKKKKRRGASVLVVDIPYHDRETGRRVRFRMDADIQSKTGAEAEARRLVGELEATGRILTRRERLALAEEEAPDKDSRMTFSEASASFFNTKAVTRLKRTTVRGYRGSLDTYMAPRWNKKAIADIGFRDFAELDADLAKQGLKPTSRANIQCAGRSVLRHCVDIGTLLEMPRLPKLPKGGEAVIRIPDDDTIDEMIAAAKPYLRRVVLLAVDAGLRAGEVQGARWMDVDLTRNTLCVRETVYYGQRDTPKSGHEREIPLTPRLMRELMEAAKTPHLPMDPLAPNSLGRVWGESSLAHAVRGLLSKLEKESHKFHSLRHYFVTSLFKAGVGAPTVRDLAGHRHICR
jgi:integrase